MESMPTPAMSHPVSIAPGPATEPMFCGSAKMPEPTVEPMMRDTSVHIVTVCVFCAVERAVVMMGYITWCRPTFPKMANYFPMRALVFAVAVALHGSKGHGCFG